MSASLMRLRRCCCLCPQAFFFVCGYMLLRPFLPAKRPCRCLQAREITVILHSDNVSQNLCKKSNKKFSVGRYKWRKI